MKHEMVMPKMGESITEGTIIKWLKKEGDALEKDEIILEISTDKVDSEIPTPVAGTLEKLLAKEGDTVEVGKVIAYISTEKVTSATAPVKQKAAGPGKETQAPTGETKPEPVSVTADTVKNKKFFSPVVLSIARGEGISHDELETITGTGLNGRITKKDILQHIAEKKPAASSVISAKVMETPAGPAGATRIIPMDHIRKKIAQHMVQTVHTSPHVGLYNEVDLNTIFNLREKNKNLFRQNEGFNLTYMPFLAEAAVNALKQFPLVNASLEGDTIIMKNFINLGIAVSTEQGLIVPVIKNADNLNLTGLARAIDDLALRARTKKLKPDEVGGGTFSLSNFGVYGTTIGFPLINQPQLAILGIGALQKRPVVINDAIAIRPVMYLSLVFDHRLIDGALGAQFLNVITDFLQSYNPNTKIV